MTRKLFHDASDPAAVRQQAKLPMRFAMIALSPVLIFVSSELLLFAFANNNVQILLPTTDLSEPAEAAARLKMFGLVFLVFVGAIVILWKFANDLKAYFIGNSRKVLYCVYIIIACIGLFFLAYMAHYTGTLRGVGQDRMGTAAFEHVFTKLQTDNTSLWTRKTYELLIYTSQVAIVFTVAALVAGSLSCLARLPGLRVKDNWKYQADRLKTYVFLGAGFLIIGVLYFKSWADYPSFLFWSEDDPINNTDYMAFSSLSDAYTSFIGIQYSAILASYVLPIAYIQAHMANNLAEKGSAKVRQQEESVTLSLGDIIQVIFAIMGPLMTGALANLASAIG